MEQYIHNGQHPKPGQWFLSETAVGVYIVLEDADTYILCAYVRTGIFRDEPNIVFRTNRISTAAFSPESRGMGTHTRIHMPAEEKEEIIVQMIEHIQEAQSFDEFKMLYKLLDI